MPTDRAVSATPPGDEGLSLLEVLMSIFVIGTVMAAVAPFLVTSVAVSDRQRRDQSAIQIANDGLERARALRATSLTVGRGKAEAERQWGAAPAEVRTLLNQMQLAADKDLPDDSVDGERAALPTKAVTVTLNKTTYSEQWYVGRCWQSKVDATPAPAPSGTPTASPCGLTATGVPFFRVVVSVEWAHSACPRRPCIYIASTLISTADDPTFETNRPPPNVIKPADQNSYTGDTVSLQVRSNGGRLPLKWVATGLPTGLSIDADSGLITGSPSAAGAFTVTVKATDKDNRSDDEQFAWSVVNDLVLTRPADQSTRPSTTVSLTVAATGGRAPLKWAATGLPAGLTINATTGVISGRTGTATQNYAVTVTVTDSGTTPRSRPASFNWWIGTPLTVASFTPPTADKNTTVDYALNGLAQGGSPPYRWATTNLPDGLSIDPATGRVTGRMLYATQFITTVIVTDSTGAQAQTDVTVKVNASGNEMRVTAPTGATRTNTAGSAITSFTATSGGSNPPSHRWTGDNLPPGVTISSTGVVSGTPTKAGTYRVTLTVANSGDLARLMFDWKIT